MAARKVTVNFEIHHLGLRDICKSSVVFGAVKLRSGFSSGHCNIHPGAAGRRPGRETDAGALRGC